MQRYVKVIFMLAVISALFPFAYYLYLQVFLAVVLLVLLFWGVFSQEINARKLLTPYTSLMVLLLVWSLLSFVWAVDRDAWLSANVILFIAVVQAVTLTYLFVDRVFKEQLVFLLIGIITTHHVIAWFEWLTSQEYLAHGGFTFHPYRQLYNPMLFFGNINDFALFILFSILFSLSWQPNLTSPHYKWVVYFFKMVLMISGLLLIHYVAARGILFSAGYAIVIYVLIHISPRKLRRWILGVGSLITLVMIAFFSLELMNFLAEDGSFVIRYHLIQNGWLHLKSMFYIGVGAGNTTYYMEHFNYYATSGFVEMHNWWMELLVTYGLPFFVIYILYHLRVFRKAYHLAVSYKNPVGKFVTIWLLGFVVAGMIPNTLFNFIWFWLIHHLVFVGIEEEIRLMSS